MYTVEQENLNIAGMDITLLHIVNVDELFAKLVAKGDDHEDVKEERIPYWADLWPSAIGLSEHIIKSKAISAAITVHEMGCGLGLPGIVSGKLGAGVLFTDYMEEALDFARQNWSLNNETPATFKKMDWRDPDPELKADVLLASDVAYEKKAFEFLLVAFRTLVNPGGKIIMSEPNRHYAMEFFDGLASQGFSVKEFVYSVLRNNIQHQVNVFEIELC